MLKCVFVVLPVAVPSVSEGELLLEICTAFGFFLLRGGRVWTASLSCTVRA
jgi:hypothetical protein